MNDELAETGGGGSEVGVPVLTAAPDIKLAQPALGKRPASIAMGQWYVPLSGEALGNKLIVVPIAHFPTRSYFPKEGDPNFVKDAILPRCSSVDGKYPVSGESPPCKDSTGETFVDNCLSCPYGRWRKDASDPRGKSRIPPLCASAINLFVVAYDPNGGSRIAVMSFSKTGFPTADLLLKSFSAQFPPKAMHLTAVEALVTGPFMNSAKQQYYKPALRILGATDKAMNLADDARATALAGFQGLERAWPDLHERIKTRVAQGNDDQPDDGPQIPF